MPGFIAPGTPLQEQNGPRLNVTGRVLGLPTGVCSSVVFARAYALLPRNQGVATMKFLASSGEANGPTKLPECLFLNVVPSTHSCSSRYVSLLLNANTSAARFPSLL